MTNKFDITIPPSALEDLTYGLLKRLDDIAAPVQAAMAERFYEIVRLNFGDFGVDRPVSWAPLSPAYARRVQREHATLFLTGRLEGAVHWDANADRGMVSVSNSDVPYATAHQYGNERGNLPARPYFPIDGAGQVLPWTDGQVREAANRELGRLLA